MTVGGVERIYNLNRANGHIDSDQLVVHKLGREGPDPLASQPNLGYVSPLESRGYPMLRGNPQAIWAPKPWRHPRRVADRRPDDDHLCRKAARRRPAGTSCPNTPSWALTNIDTGKPRKPNNDVTTIRVATTPDGINFTDIGTASGLQDPTSTAFNAIRWLGSGSIVALSNGRYGLFFGAGNCLDNDSDGFHFIGYAETATAVNSPSDLLNWTVVYGSDNPILSTDTVTDPMGNTYPADPPLIDVTGADVLTRAQVSPWTPPTGYNTNFFSGRIYDPQALYTGRSTLTIVFAGYNTPQPSSNLAD